MEISFQNRKCVVIGASSGIGLAVAELLRNAGADVVIASSNKQKLDLAQSQLSALKGSGKLTSLVVDLANTQSIREFVAQCNEQLGCIDILINCGGISISSTLSDLPESGWDKVMDVNLKAAYVVSTEAANTMINNRVKQGRIINVSSIAGKTGEFGNGAYSVSKAGVNSLTQVLAKELGEHGICVSAVAPGYTDTELLRDALSTRGQLEGKSVEAYTNELASTVALKRLAKPAEIANVIVFLSSDYASYVSGTVVTVDGGKSLL